MYPALAAAESMLDLYPDVMLYFVGTLGGFERPLVQKSGIVFAAHDEVYAGPLHGVNPIRLVSSLARLSFGTVQALFLLRRRKPQAVLSTGGWVSLPVALAARVLGVPLLIYLPDIEPGLTIKRLRPLAHTIALTVPESVRFFNPDKTVVTGYPLRKHMREATRADGQPYFGLDPARQTLLVFGGSRGSRAINIAFGEIVADVLAAGVQVIHVTGTLDWERSQQQIDAHPHYHPYAYLDDIGLAFAVADLVICRAGASILGEFPYFQLPSILIPLAYSWHYQQVNADYLSERGAAIRLDEERMADELLPLIQTLLEDSARLASMRSRAAVLAQPDGAANLARTLAGLV